MIIRENQQTDMQTLQAVFSHINLRSEHFSLFGIQALVLVSSVQQFK